MLPILAFGEPAPHELGGIKLGTDITEYPHLEYTNFLKEVVVTNWNGFAKGLISYGICENPGSIIKIKFKYSDTSKRFYKGILQTYKKQFGEANTWEGDVFGIQHVWKWSFIDSENNRIAMILQHNLKNPKLPIGTVVTLSYPDRIESEKTCYDKKHAMNSNNADHSNCGPDCPLKKDLDSRQFMVPR